MHDRSRALHQAAHAGRAGFIIPHSSFIIPHHSRPNVRRIESAVLELEGLDGILGGAKERLDSQVLLDLFEEELDPPARLVELAVVAADRWY